MTKEKTTLLSLWNQDWEKIMMETKKLNKLLPNISTELIYTGAKVVCVKTDEDEQKYKTWMVI